MVESEEELKSILMKVKEESEKVGLKLKIQKTMNMVSGPITSWQINGETMETVRDFIFFWGGAPKSAFRLYFFWEGSSKIWLQMVCSQEIKRHLLLVRKAMDNIDSILKSRDITLPIKVRLVKAMVFPVVMYGCENWSIKKAEY